MDLTLVNCKIATSNGIQEGGVAIEEGKIVCIAKSGFLPKADSKLDCEGNLVIPGGVDAHVHFKTHNEDWRSGSESAAAGGVTFVMDHGLANPPSSTVENLKTQRAEASTNSIIDFSINGSVDPNKLAEIPRLIEAGVLAFGEVFMAESIEGSCIIDDKALFAAFKEIGKSDCIVGVHAENGHIISFLTQELKSEGRKDPIAHIDARPDYAEAEAINRALTIARLANARLHIYHLTTSLGIRLLAQARRHSQQVSAETCPHYLLFEKEDMVKFGPYLKCNPPIRSRQDKECLWKALASSEIDMVSSDHWPSLRSDKEVGWTNIWKADSGMPGVETRIPLLITYGVKKGLISIGKLVEIVSENPARIFGLYPRKGAIAVGSDADLAVIDMKKKVKLRAANLHTKSDFTPYEGLTVTGIPVKTLVRGQLVMQNSQAAVTPGYGKLVRRNNQSFAD